MKKRLPELKQQVVNNWLYKVVALFVALSIWITTIQGRKDAMLVRPLDVVIELGKNYVVTNNVEKNISVKVIGSRASLKKYMQNPSTLIVNLTNEKEGLKHIEIKPSDINLPTGVKLKSLSPTTLDIEIKEVANNEDKK